MQGILENRMPMLTHLSFFGNALRVFKLCKCTSKYTLKNLSHVLMIYRPFYRPDLSNTCNIFAWIHYCVLGIYKLLIWIQEDNNSFTWSCGICGYNNLGNGLTIAPNIVSQGDKCYGHTLHSEAFKFQSMNVSPCYIRLSISYDLLLWSCLYYF
jgi:hypothetical protein